MSIHWRGSTPIVAPFSNASPSFHPLPHSSGVSTLHRTNVENLATTTQAER